MLGIVMAHSNDYEDGRMVSYVKRIGGDLISNITANMGFEVIYSLDLFMQEIDRLDPRDFCADSQYDFATSRHSLRSKFARWKNNRSFGTNPADYPIVQGNAQIVLDALDNYAGERSRGIQRTFVFVTDPGLRAMVERDYKELSQVLLPGGAWKSTVVLAGSILEAILFNLLEGDPTRKSKALASPEAPRGRGGNVKPLNGENWRLQDLIKVSTEICLLPAARADTFDQVLRDYRNFIHPNKEKRAGHPCTEAEALVAKGALDGVCNHLESVLLPVGAPSSGP